MKIYMTGSHCVGKSTLARYISEKYKLPFISEVARMILSEKELQVDALRYDMDLVDQFQQEVFNRQLVEESKHISFVSDRCFDHLAYAAQHTRILPKLINCPELQAYLETLRSLESIIFFVRPSKATLKADGVRENITWDGIVSIDAMIKMLLEIYNLRYFQISMDNMQERIKLTSNIIDMSYYK